MPRRKIEAMKIYSALLAMNGRFTTSSKKTYDPILLPSIQS
jgi:hypothetical protein